LVIDRLADLSPFRFTTMHIYRMAINALGGKSAWR